MNEEHKKIFNISFAGNSTIEQEKLELLIRNLLIQNQTSATDLIISTAQKPEGKGKLPRLAYTMKETAEILGVSYITVHRFIQRGLLKCSVASRHKIISKMEIER